MDPHATELPHDPLPSVDPTCPEHGFSQPIHKIMFIAACIADTDSTKGASVLLFNSLSYYFLLTSSMVFLRLNWIDTSMRKERVAKEHECSVGDGLVDSG